MKKKLANGSSGGATAAAVYTSTIWFINTVGALLIFHNGQIIDPQTPASLTFHRVTVLHHLLAAINLISFRFWHNYLHFSLLLLLSAETF